MKIEVGLPLPRSKVQNEIVEELNEMIVILVYCVHPSLASSTFSYEMAVVERVGKSSHLNILFTS